MGAGVLSPEDALRTWSELVAATGLRELQAPQPFHAAHFRSLVAGRAAMPKLWTDAWLAALALSLGCEMVTFDQGFRALSGLALKLLEP